MNTKKEGDGKTMVGRYQLIQKLGSGGFSSVYLCEDEKGMQYALKKIRDVKQRYVQQELDALMTVQSPYIVTFVENFVYEEYPIIVMEYCMQGTLDQYLKTFPNANMKEEVALEFFSQILIGFKTIHKAGFIHRDLKCSNILIHDSKPKISDFGLAMKVSSNQMISSNSCTLTYAAPEVLRGKQHGYKVDIWSLGVILYKMLFGCLPFEGDSTQKVLKKIEMLCEGGFKVNNAPKRKTQDISVGLIKLLKDIFVMDPSKRIGFRDLYKSPCISQYSPNVEASIEFYANEGKENSLSALLLTSQEKRGDVDDEEEEEQKAKLRREDSMLTSRVLVQCALDQEETMKNYWACINQYAFIIDTYAFINAEMRMLTMSLEMDHIALLKFFLSKLIVYYLIGLKKIIDEKDNTFGLSIDWAQFVFSKSYKAFQERVRRDLLCWRCEFDNMLEEVALFPPDKFPSLFAYLNDSFECKDPYYEKIPDSLKLPLRAVVMTNIKILFHALNGSNTNQLSPPPMILLKQKYQQPRGLLRERDSRSGMLLRLAYCAAWNRIFSISNIFSVCGSKISYEELIQIMNESDRDTCLKKTINIMENYFVTLKDFKYNFL